MTHRRVGASLVELLVGMTLAAIIGLSVMRTFVSQARFSDTQVKMASARSVSRAPLNLLMSDVRMVEVGNGIAAASAASGASSITLRVPVVMGVVCGTSGGSTVLSLMPVDSAVLAAAAWSGHAYRESSGAYTYAEGATTVTPVASTACAAANITTVAGGRTVMVTPALPASVAAGTPAFVYQRARYWFGASSALPGRLALWRTLEASNASEELAAPFDTTSRLRFYRNNNDTSDVAVPPLAEIRGVELVLVGESEHNQFGSTTPERAPLRTAVFFINRID